MVRATAGETEGAPWEIAGLPEQSRDGVAAFRNLFLPTPPLSRSCSLCYTRGFAYDKASSESGGTGVRSGKQQPRVVADCNARRNVRFLHFAAASRFYVQVKTQAWCCSDKFRGCAVRMGPWPVIGRDREEPKMAFRSRAQAEGFILSDTG